MRLKVITFLSSLAVCLALAACTASPGLQHGPGQSQGSEADSGAAPTAAFGGLPPLSSLPQADGPARRSSASFESLSGSDFVQASTAVTVVDSSAQFSPEADSLAYAIYRFNVQTDDYLAALTLYMSNRSGSEPVWIGLSNFTSGRWDFLSSAASPALFDLNNVSQDYSNGQDFFVAVLGFGTGPFSLDGLTLDFGTPPFEGWQGVWGSVDGFETPIAVAFDSAGNVLVLGNYDAPSAASEGETCALLKYSSSGSLLQARTFHFDADDSSFGTPHVSPSNILLDSSDNVYISGSYAYWPDDSGLNMNDGSMLKLNSNLEVQWARRLRRASSDGLGPMAFDANGNLLVLGFFSGDTGGGDFQSFLLTVSPSGDLVSQKLIGGQLAGLLNQLSLEDSSQDIYMSGYYGSVFDGVPYWAKINADGSLAWAGHLTIDGSSYAAGIIGDGSGGAHVVCTEGFPGFGSSSDDGVVYLGLAEDGTLSSAQLYEIPGIDLNPEQGKQAGAELQFYASFFDSIASEVGTVIISLGPAGPASFDAEFFRADYPAIRDWAFNGSAWAFTDSVLGSVPGTQLYRSLLPGGSFTDISESLSISDDQGSLSNLDCNWTSEGGIHQADTVAEVLGPDEFGEVPGFEFLTTYLPVSN